MKLNEITITTNQTYMLKLKKALDLILNDLPDNRDDTINAKLLDSLKVELSQNKDLFNFLRSYLIVDILINDKFKANLIKKEPEIIQFFIDLISVFIQSLTSSNEIDHEFLTTTLEFIQSYFESHFNTFFLNESIISCSILNLVLNLYDLTIDSSSGLNTLLDKYLFTQDALINHLHIDCKSIFVRKLYKQLLNKHFIYLINNLHNQSKRERLENLISTISLLNYEVKINNLDIYSNLIHYYFIQNDADKSNAFKLLHQLFDFKSDKLNYVNNLINFTNDASIEAFTYTYVFDLIISDTNTNLYDLMLNDLNEITVSLIKKSLHAETFKPSLFKKEVDHLLKFLIYFYSFLTQFKKMSLYEILNEKLDLNAFEVNLEKVKLFILKLLAMPFCLNSSHENFNCIHLDHSFTIRETYYDLVNEFCLKQILLKQCLINFKLFLRKFQNFNLFKFVTSKHMIYILRHLDLDLDTKNKLLDILVDFYSSMSDKQYLMCSCLKEFNLINLTQLIDSFCDLFHLKLNETLNDNMLKLIRIQFEFNTNNNYNLCEKLIPIIHGHLNNDNLNVLLSFLTSLLATKSFTHLVISILDSNKCLILEKCSHFVLMRSDCDDTLHELKDSIYQFYKNLFSNLKQSKLVDAQFLNLFSSQFIQMNENACLEETEAFIRRELVQFLISYYLYKHETNLNQSIDLVKTFNYFSRLVLNDFDWQVQLYCLEFFETIIKNLDLEKLKLVLVESDILKSLFTSLDDSDQHVVTKSAKLILNLKSNHLDLLQNFSHEYSDKLDEDKLHSLIEISTRTSDLYTLNPTGILDDIISSYQFEIDDEKFIDCY